jgi:hypothetical protein
MIRVPLGNRTRKHRVFVNCGSSLGELDGQPKGEVATRPARDPFQNSSLLTQKRCNRVLNDRTTNRPNVSYFTFAPSKWLYRNVVAISAIFHSSGVICRIPALAL